MMKTAISINVSLPQFTQYKVPSEPDSNLIQPNSSEKPQNDNISTPNNTSSSETADLPERRILSLHPQEQGDNQSGSSSLSPQNASSNQLGPASTSYTRLVFNLKEFRAMLGFATGIGTPITLAFTEREEFILFFILANLLISTLIYFHLLYVYLLHFLSPLTFKPYIICARVS